MAQYQSFPDASGDSRTLEKLKALSLPSLAGRRFLDVGCNEGFFCGFAKFQGAERSVGLDHSSLFIQRAQKRFPDCEFHIQSWDNLPEGFFDVILLASALHYAEDQPGLIHRLVERLSPSGVLVLELGIVSLAKSEWSKVKRGIDERYFPTMSKLREVLTGYAWKWMGPSVSQDGDPVPRHVIHISRRRPIAYLLLQPPGYGKTSIANDLFGRASIPVVSGDELILQVATGKRNAPERLHQQLADKFSPFHIDRTIRAAFDAGLAPDLIALWLSEASEGSFALDVYVPEEHQATVELLLAEAEYLPVCLRWNRVGLMPLATEVMAQQTENYFAYLAENVSASEDGEKVSRHEYRGGKQGYVDSFNVRDGQATIRGWAVDESGAAPRLLTVKVAERVHAIKAFDRMAREDVQSYLQLPHPLLGYRIDIPVPVGSDELELLQGLEVRVGDGADALLPFADPLLQRLR